MISTSWDYRVFFTAKFQLQMSQYMKLKEKTELGNRKQRNGCSDPQLATIVLQLRWCHVVTSQRHTDLQANAAGDPRLNAAQSYYCQQNRSSRLQKSKSKLPHLQSNRHHHMSNWDTFEGKKQKH